MIPALFLFDFEIRLERFADITHLLNILYLGLGASALCFVTWNLAVKVLGAVKTSIYICMTKIGIFQDALMGDIFWDRIPEKRRRKLTEKIKNCLKIDKSNIA